MFAARRAQAINVTAQMDGGVRTPDWLNQVAVVQPQTGNKRRVQVADVAQAHLFPSKFPIHIIIVDVLTEL